MSKEDKINLDTFKERIINLEQHEILLWSGTLNKNESIKIEGISKFKRLKLWITNIGYIYINYRDNGSLEGITFFIYANNLFIGVACVKVNTNDNTIQNIACGFHEILSLSNLVLEKLNSQITEIYGVF